METAIPPHQFFIKVDGLQLSINIIFISILGGIGKRSNLNLPFGDPAHVVILNGDPVHKRPKNLVLDLLDAAMHVKVFSVGHHRCGYDLRQAETNSEKQ